MHDFLTEEFARQQIRDRIQRASAPRVHRQHRRQLARRLRRFADRLEG